MRINLTEVEAKIFERLLLAKEEGAQRLAFAERALRELREHNQRLQGKIDGAVEILAEREGVDFNKISAHHVDTDKKEIHLTFAPVDEPIGEEGRHAN